MLMTRQTAVKSLGENRIGGYLVAFGSANDVDLDGEYFTKDTNFELNWYDKRPALYNHGTDKSVKTEAIGTIDKIVLREDSGLWAEAQLRDSFMYREYVMKWLSEGKLGWSSGACAYNVEVDKDGFIRTWPIQEGSLTLTPAQPDKTAIVPVKNFHYTDAHILHDAVKSLGLEYSNIEDIVLNYDKSYKKPNGMGAGTANGKVVSVNSEGLTEKADTPINITINMFDSVEDKKSSAQNYEENDNRKVSDMDNQEVKEAEGVVEETITTLEEPVVQPVIKEVDSVDLGALVSDRMYAHSVIMTDSEVEEAASKVANWIQSRTLSEEVTNEQVKQARQSNEFQSFLNELVKSYIPSEEEEVKSEGVDELAEMKAELAALRNMVGKGGQSNIPVSDGKPSAPVFIEDYEKKAPFEHYGLGDIAQYIEWRDTASRRGLLQKAWQPEDFLMDILYDRGKNVIPEIADLIPNHSWIHNDIESEGIHAVKAFRAMAENRGKAIKANEILHSTQTGFGSEWIYSITDGTLWQSILSTTQIASQFPKFNMTAGQVTMLLDDDIGLPSTISEPTDSSDVTQLGLFPVSKLPTSSVTFNARHIGHQTIISRVELEDARIDVVSAVRRRLMHSIMRGMDWAILNADTVTAATGNVASDDAAPASGSLILLGFNGLAKRALGTGGNASNASGTMTMARLRAGKLMLNERYFARPSDLRVVMNPSAYEDLKALDDYRQFQYSGITNVANSANPAQYVFEGTPVILSEEAVDSDDDGKVNTTASNLSANTDSRVFWFVPDRFKIGIRRRANRVMREVGTFQEQIQLGISVRWDFQGVPVARDVDSMVYNIG